MVLKCRYMENTYLTGLITPAIVISVIAYLSHFFGKIINDQSPFSDNESWAIELRGVLFTLDIALLGIWGVYLANLSSWGYPHWWIHIITLIVISMMAGALFLSNIYLAAKFFNADKNNIKLLEEKTQGFIEIFAMSDKYINSGIFSLILFYFGTLEYLSKNIYFIIFYFPIIFYVFILLAHNFSLKKSIKGKIVLVDIYFKDANKEMIKGAVILKYNEDNIRVRLEDKIIILNKNEVFKIEMVISQNRL